MKCQGNTNTILLKFEVGFSNICTQFEVVTWRSMTRRVSRIPSRPRRGDAPESTNPRRSLRLSQLPVSRAHASSQVRFAAAPAAGAARVPTAPSVGAASYQRRGLGLAVTGQAPAGSGGARKPSASGLQCADSRANRRPRSVSLWPVLLTPLVPESPRSL